MAQIPTGIDVLITHGPPAGLGDRDFDGRSTGCADLRHRLEQLSPPLHLFGHLHESGGAWLLGRSTIANVTTAEGARGARVFHFVNGVATPVVVPPAQP